MIINSIFDDTNKDFNDIKIENEKNFIIDIKETMKDVGIIETIEFDYQEIDEKIENDERKKRILRPRFRGREWNISLMTNW